MPPGTWARRRRKRGVRSSRPDTDARSASSVIREPPSGASSRADHATCMWALAVSTRRNELSSELRCSGMSAGSRAGGPKSWDRRSGIRGADCDH